MAFDSRLTRLRRGRAWLVVLPALVFGWLLFWLFHFGDTLINDEYLAIDYFYRIMREGRLYPTPQAFHKPLSVLMGVFAWLAESALGYEAAVAALAAAFVTLLYLAVRREAGTWAALLAALAVALHPDLMYYTARGSTVIANCAFCFGAVLAAQKRERKGSLAAYAACLFLAGLIRTEPWILFPAAALWWWPKEKSARGFAPLFSALLVMGMAPAIWLGKDWFINQDLMHGFKIAVRVREIGWGQPFSLADALLSFWIKVPNKVSWPVTLGAAAGAVMFARERGLRPGLTHPLLMFPVLTSVFLAAVIAGGIYANPWYFYFDSVFAVIFCAIFVRGVIAGLGPHAGTALKAAVFFAGLFLALAMFLARGGTGLEAGRWLILGSCGAVVAAAAALMWGPLLVSRVRPVALVGVMALAAMSFFLMCLMLYRSEYDELELEAQKMREMVAVAEYLRHEIPEGRGDRIMMPSRRNEQFSWLWRDREIPDVFTERESFYWKQTRNIELTQLHPDWIIYIDHDVHFHGTQDEYGWMQNQDHTSLYGVNIDLIMRTKLVRVFKVTYPPGCPPRGPLPPIP